MWILLEGQGINPNSILTAQRPGQFYHHKVNGNSAFWKYILKH